MTTTVNQSEIATTKNTAIDSFVAQYNQAAKKTVRSILFAAKVVLSARDQLANKEVKKSDYIIFLERINMSESEADKLCVIAKQESRIEDFLSIAETVDMKQTAVYELAQLSDDDYQKNLKSKFVVDVTKTNNVIAFTQKDIAAANTAKVAKAEAKKAAKQSAPIAALADLKAESVTQTKDDAEDYFADLRETKVAQFVLDVSNLSSDEQNALCKELEALAKKYRFDFSNNLTEEALALAA